MEAETRSRAWQMGYDAASVSSSRKPPKGASATWQAEYWAGHAEGARHRVKAFEEFHARYPHIYGGKESSR